MDRRKRPVHAGPEGPYGIRTRAAAVRGRCPRPLDEWAVRRGSVPNQARRVPGEAVTAWDGLGVGVAAVDAGLEAAADVLAGREERVVAHAAGREFHDAYRLVTFPVAARIRSRLIERPQAIVLPP